MVFPAGKGFGLLEENRMPARQNTIAWEVDLPEYEEGLLFSRDYRSGDHSWPNNTNRLLPWRFQKLADLGLEDYRGISSNGCVLRQGDALLLALENGNYLFLKAIAGENCISWLKVEKTGTLKVYVSTLGEDYLPAQVPVLLYAVDHSVYTVMDQAYHKLAKESEVANLQLQECKVLLEPFQFLRRCTWEHYRRNISENQLLQDIQRIENSDIPVRYVLIDDGHVCKNKD